MERGGYWKMRKGWIRGKCVLLAMLLALLGTGIFGCTIYMAFSQYGRIQLGQIEKPLYSSFQWGTMIFTSTMAADILF